jgi:hypothetical protein
MNLGVRSSNLFGRATYIAHSAQIYFHDALSARRRSSLGSYPLATPPDVALLEREGETTEPRNGIER